MIKINRYKNIIVKIPVPSQKDSFLWGDFYFAESLRKYFLQQGFNAKVLFHLECDSFVKNFWYKNVVIVRGIEKANLKSTQINIMWNISHPDDITTEEYIKYDAIGIASRHWAENVRDSIGEDVKVSALLQATDHEVFHLPQNNEKQYKTDILFVGNSRNVYRKSVKYAIEGGFNLTLYGSNWNQFIHGDLVKKENIANKELYKYYSSAKVVLNDHWDDMAKKGFVSNRIYDALACEAVILTDDVVEMDPKIKRFLTVYYDKKDFNNKLKDILKNNEKYKKKAEGAREYIIKKYSFQARAEEMISILETCNKSGGL